MTKFLLPAVLVFFTLGCEEAKRDVYQVTGVVQKVKNETTAVITHEEIPGYMMKMTMPFRVKDVSELEELKPGDEVAFDYIVEELSSWIENVEVTGGGGSVVEPRTATDDQLKQRLGVGDLLPDYAFVDEFGLARKISDHRGVPVALTFVFTRCPVPEYCPRMMNHFAEADRLLKADTEAPEGYQLLTISFDAEYDTPEVMKEWGEGYGYEKGQWSLLSSSSGSEIDQIALNVGLLFGEDRNGSYQHNLRTVVLDKEGRIAALFTDENWTPVDLVEAVKSADKKNSGD